MAKRWKSGRVLASGKRAGCAIGVRYESISSGLFLPSTLNLQLSTFLSPGQRMKGKAGGAGCRRIEVDGVIAAVVEQFGARQGRAEPHVERPPVMRFVQGGTETVDVAAKKADRRNAREQPAFPQNQIGVEMANDR